jgi:hypothetical protein
LTSSTEQSFFWDSCVIGRYLTEVPLDCVPDIATYLAEARQKKVRIYISTLMIPEIRPWMLQKKGLQNFQDLIDDLEGCLFMVGPTPPILMQAARLRNFSYHRDPRQKDEKVRVLSGMDSVHLATCLYVRDVLGVADIRFHTFDDGRGENYEQKAVSLLRYHEYSSHLLGDLDVQSVCRLPREHPKHPQPKLV